MKFLVDANLPPRLCVWLRIGASRSRTSFDCHLLTATDTQIWERCSAENLVILSKDVDFYDRALLSGAPPQIVTVAIPGFSRCWLMNGLTSNGLLYPAEGAKSTITNYDQAHPRA